MMGNMAKISFIEHKKAMFKEKRKLKVLLIITNIAWFVAVVFLSMR